VVSCGRTDGRKYRQIDMTKLVVGFRSFANTPGNSALPTERIYVLQWFSEQTALIFCPLQQFRYFCSLWGSVYCAVRTYSSNVIRDNFSLWARSQNFEMGLLASSSPSARSSEWKNSAPDGRILM
jgi:hypothetical protein